MLGQMPGKALNFVDQRHGLGQPLIRGIQPDLAQTFVLKPVGREKPPKLGRDRGNRVFGQPHRLADLPDRPLPPVMDHRRAQAGAVAAIPLVNVLDHLFAPLMLEIHIDIGGLVAGFRDETLEHHGADFWRNGGDAKAVADHRIGGRPAPLAQDIARPGKGHDIMHRQEIGIISKLGDQGQFMLQKRAHLLGRPRRIAPFQPLMGEAPQPCAGIFAIGHFGRILIAQLIQRKGQAFGDLTGSGHGILMACKKPQHLGT